MKILMFTLCLLLTTLGFAMHAETTNQNTRKIVILLGPPGSGKGTQAVRLSKELGIPHISTGDLFRDNIGRNTDLGKKAKSFIDIGKLVTDELVFDMLFDRVSRPDCQNGYLLDGFPRSVAQAEALEQRLKPNDKVIALNLNVKDEIILKRISGRLTCKKCGHVLNKFFSPPAKENICDKCQGELMQRTDDSPHVVQERLKVYHEQTEPVVEFYQKKGILVQINGENDPEIVFKDLTQSLSSR